MLNELHSSLCKHIRSAAFSILLHRACRHFDSASLHLSRGQPAYASAIAKLIVQARSLCPFAGARTPCLAQKNPLQYFGFNTARDESSFYSRFHPACLGFGPGPLRLDGNGVRPCCSSQPLRGGLQIYRDRRLPADDLPLLNPCIFYSSRQHVCLSL